MFAATAAMLCVASSCSLDEPEGMDYKSSNVRLVAVGNIGEKFLTAGYDAAGHLSTVVMSGDCKYDLEWDGSTLESVEVTELYDEEDYDYEYGYGYGSEPDHEVWTDIERNAKGYITSYTDDEAKYEMTYDADGHLLSVDARSIYGWNPGYTRIVKYTWTDNLLTRIEIGSATLTVKYSEVANEHLQWDPVLPVWGAPLTMANLFGVAPSHYVSSITNAGGWNSDMDFEEFQVAYQIGENGFIRTGRYYDGYPMTVSFQYEEY